MYEFEILGTGSGERVVFDNEADAREEWELLKKHRGTWNLTLQRREVGEWEELGW